MQNEPGFDVFISGTVVCNNYADVYYEADLTAFTDRGPVVVLSERPPHGNRQLNLAIEFVNRLDTELAQQSERTERQRALGELRGL